MKYTRDGDRITLEMTVDDYSSLMVMMGMVLGLTYSGSDRKMARECTRFVNEMNADNPAYKPYAIPPE
jgi:hypothetical protein